MRPRSVVAFRQDGHHVATSSFLAGRRRRCRDDGRGHRAGRSRRRSRGTHLRPQEGAAAHAAEQIHARLTAWSRRNDSAPSAASDAKARLDAVDALDDSPTRGSSSRPSWSSSASSGAVRDAREGLLRRRDPRHQHLDPVGHRDRSGLRQPERVTGMHFFNPAPLMAWSRCPREPRPTPTSPPRGRDRHRLGQDAGALCVDAGVRGEPGGPPVLRRGDAILEQGGAERATIDAVLREAAGFPMGPFELADLVGNDVNLAVGRSVWEQTFGDPRYSPFVASSRSSTRVGSDARPGGAGIRTGPRRRRPQTAEARRAPEQVIYHGGFAACYGLLDRIAAGGVGMERYDTGPAGGSWRCGGVRAR